MNLEATTLVVPLRTDEVGVIRLGNTRVTLETVIADFQRGATPHEIAHHFPVLEIADIYVVIGYYLQHQTIVDVYLQHQRAENERLRQAYEAEYPPKPTRDELLARMESKRNDT